MVLDYLIEFEIVKEIKNIIESSYQMEIFEFESYYLVVLFIFLRENFEVGWIGIVVVVYGNSIVSSMV